MADEILIRFRWTADELLNGYRWHFRHRIRAVYRWAFWILVVAFIAGGASQMMLGGSASGGLPVLFAGLYLAFYFRLLRPWLIRRQFAKRPDRDSEIEWRISGELIHAGYAHAHSEITWPALVKVVQSPAGFLLYSTEQIFHWLPRHGFCNDDDFGKLADLARQHAAAFHRCDS